MPFEKNFVDGLPFYKRGFGAEDGEYNEQNSEKRKPILSNTDQYAFDVVYQAFTNDGIVTDPQNSGSTFELSMNDAITQSALTRFIPDVVTTIIREAIEPETIIGPALFQNISVRRSQSRIELGSVGGMRAGEISPGQEYPSAEIQMGPGFSVSLDATKKGLKISFFEEIIEDSLFDIVTLYLSAAGRALARLREEMAILAIRDYGIDYYDNSGGTSIYGSCTGRNIAAAGNGSMTVNDLTQMYGGMVMRGYAPTHCINHPLAWMMWASDAEMREIVLHNGQVISQRQPKGSGPKAWGTTHGGLGLATAYGGSATGGANPWVNTPNPLGASYYVEPRNLPAPLTMLVTPYATFDNTGGLGGTPASGKPITTISLADARLTGVCTNRKPVTMGEWTDVERDIKNIKVSEVYGHGVLEQGKSLGNAKNVVIDRNYVFENTNVQTLESLTSTDTYAS